MYLIINIVQVKNRNSSVGIETGLWPYSRGSIPNRGNGIFLYSVIYKWKSAAQRAPEAVS